MHNENRHLSDPELLQNLDGELHGRRAAAANTHLAACWTCRSRQSLIESKISEFMEIHSRIDIPPSGRSRHVLEGRLAELAAVRPGVWERSLRFADALRPHAYIGILLAAFFSVAASIHFLMPGVQASWIPNARLTPGMVRPVTRNEVCASPGADDPHPVPNPLAFRVFNSYGIRDPQPRTYEVDYLITPALGGTEDVRNLWPEPYTAGVWNAHVKDALEDRLHDLVCSGQLDLKTAQHDIASNWIEAYKKYFHSNQPLELHASFSKDPPWE